MFCVCPPQILLSKFPARRAAGASQFILTFYIKWKDITDITDITLVHFSTHLHSGTFRTTILLSSPGRCKELKGRRLHNIYLYTRFVYYKGIKSRGCSLNIVFFLKFFWIFRTLPVLLQRWCSTCLACVHTLTSRENRVRKIY